MMNECMAENFSVFIHSVETEFIVKSSVCDDEKVEKKMKNKNIDGVDGQKNK